MARSSELRTSSAVSRCFSKFRAAVSSMTRDKSIAARTIHAGELFLFKAMAFSTCSMAFSVSPHSRKAAASATDSSQDFMSHNFSMRSTWARSCSIANAFNATMRDALASASWESMNGSIVRSANRESNPTRSNHAARRARVALLAGVLLALGL